MRGLFWLLALSGAAVLAALVLRDFQGNVVFLVPPYRVDVSLAGFIVAVLLAFALVHALLRVVAVLLNMPAMAAAYRERRRREQASALFARAVVDLSAGRFTRALQAASEATRDPEQRPAALLVAAQAAHGLHDRPRRDALLAQAEEHGNLKEAALLASAQSALDDREPRRALQVLERLGSGAGRRVQALRLKLQAARHAGATAEVLRITHLLEKHHDLSAEAASALAERAALDQLAAARHDADRLRHVWLKLDARWQLRPRVAIAAAGHFAALGLHRPARELLIDTIDATPADDRELLWAALAGLLQGVDSAFLARAERWTVQAPRSAAAALVAGAACVRLELWGKARQFLSSAQNGERQVAARASWELGAVEERLGNAEAAARAYKQAAELMATVPLGST
ncbi:MAG: heme biosynthesis protein HemY [Betaproteobacteria bacterium]|nr:heme biosynthesis protein HemY [Betaproteobacteria bacterium]